MKLRIVCISLIVTSLVPIGVTPALAASTPRAEIAFANHGGIRDWRANGTRGIWVQAAGGRWYYANFSFPCTGLPFATRIRFKTGPFGELDRWGSINVGRDMLSCNFVGFKASDRPMLKRNKGRAAQALAAASRTKAQPVSGGG